jgi:hypothetical protein
MPTGTGQGEDEEQHMNTTDPIDNEALAAIQLSNAFLSGTGIPDFVLSIERRQGRWAVREVSSFGMYEGFGATFAEAWFQMAPVSDRKLPRAVTQPA